MHLYFDHSTVSPPSPRAIAEMQPFLQSFWASPWAPYRKGQEVAQQLNLLYQKIRQLIGIADADQMIVTSSSSEAISQILFSVYREVTIKTGKNHFLYPETAEAPILKGMKGLESFGCIRKAIPVHPTGYVTPNHLIEAISPRTALVSLSMANGLTGVKQPIEEIASICRQRGILLHVDVSAIFGKQAWNPPKADFWTLEGKIIGAPIGGGILVGVSHAPLVPLIFGGQEPLQTRGGMPSLAMIAGLMGAMEDALDGVDAVITETARIKAQFEEDVLQQIRGAKICLEEMDRLPYCTSVFFPGVVGEALFFLLHRKGIALSMGGGYFQQLSLVLQACGMEAHETCSALSFSFGKENQDAEVNVLMRELVSACRHLQKIGGYHPF